MPDAIFGVPRLAAIFDALDPDRSDLDVYAALLAELGARSVVDIGCGTGTFAIMLADRGLDVTGVDPALASLDVARSKSGGSRVRWVPGDASALAPGFADAVTMTANVAQAIATDHDWAVTLEGARRALRPDGRLIFETRDPAAQAWTEWNRAASHRVVELEDVGGVETWLDLLDVALPLVTFRHTLVFAADGAVLTSDSTLRFRPREEVVADLAAHGFEVAEIRDAPDRPGREFVFVAVRT